MMMMAASYCAECGKEEEASVSRSARHVQGMYVCSSITATPRVKRIIGRNIKKTVNDMPPSYMTRRCSKTRRLKKTVPSASYQCQRRLYVVSRFHPRQ